MAKAFRWWLPLSIFFLPLIYTEQVLDPALVPRFVFLCISVFIGAILAILAKMPFDRETFSHPIVICYAAYSMFTLLSGFGAISFSEWVFEAIRVLVELSFLILCVTWFGFFNNKEVFVKSGILILLLIGAFSIYQVWFIGWEAIHTDAGLYQVVGLSAHKNLLASFLLLGLFFTILGLSFNGFWKGLSFFCLFLQLTLIIILQTRSVWIAFALGVTIACGLLVFTAVKEKGINKLLKNPLLYGFLIVVGLFIFFLNKDQKLKHKFSSAFEITQFDKKAELTTYALRYKIWTKTVHMFKDHPVFGVGAGNWEIHFPKYGLDDLELETASGIKHYQRPHNDFLWVFSETGVLGGLSYLLFFMFLLGICFRNYLIDKDDRNTWFAGAIVFTAYCFISLTDFPKERIEHQAFLLSISGLIISLRKRNHNPKESLKLYLVFAIVALFGLFVGIKRWVGEYHSRKLLEGQDLNDLDQVKSEGRNAISPFYTMDSFSAPITWYIGVAEYSEGNLNSALVDFENAYSIHPNHLHVINNLASTYEKLGRRREAENLYLKALSISPRFQESILNLCAIYFNQGLILKAYQTIERGYVKVEDPRYNLFLLTVLKAMVNHEIKNESVPERKSLLEKSLKDDKTLIEAFVKARGNQLPFIEVLYSQLLNKSRI